MNFELHPNLINKIFIADLPLCKVLLEDECHYPWILLIPRRRQVAKIMDLDQEDQLQLMTELDLAQKILWNAFDPIQLNVAAIGNKTPQLHVHVIARRLDDPAWPHTVWDHSIRASYDAEQREQMIHLLRSSFQLCRNEDMANAT